MDNIRPEANATRPIQDSRTSEVAPNETDFNELIKIQSQISNLVRDIEVQKVALKDLDEGNLLGAVLQLASAYESFMTNFKKDKGYDELSKLPDYFMEEVSLVGVTVSHLESLQLDIQQCLKEEFSWYKAFRTYCDKNLVNLQPALIEEQKNISFLYIRSLIGGVGTDKEPLNITLLNEFHKRNRQELWVTHQKEVSGIDEIDYLASRELEAKTKTLPNFDPSEHKHDAPEYKEVYPTGPRSWADVVKTGPSFSAPSNPTKRVSKTANIKRPSPLSYIPVNNFVKEGIELGDTARIMPTLDESELKHNPPEQKEVQNLNRESPRASADDIKKAPSSSAATTIPAQDVEDPSSSLNLDSPTDTASNSSETDPALSFTSETNIGTPPESAKVPPLQESYVIPEPTLVEENLKPPRARLEPVVVKKGEQFFLNPTRVRVAGSFEKKAEITVVSAELSSNSTSTNSLISPVATTLTNTITSTISTPAPSLSPSTGASLSTTSTETTSKAEKTSVTEIMKKTYLDSLQTLDKATNHDKKFIDLLKLINDFVKEAKLTEEVENQVKAVLLSLRGMNDSSTKSKVLQSTLKLLLSPGKEAVEDYKALGAQIVKDKPQSKAAQALYGAMMALGAVVLTLGILICAGTVAGASLLGAGAILGGTLMLAGSSFALFSTRNKTALDNKNAEEVKEKMGTLGAGMAPGG